MCQDLLSQDIITRDPEEEVTVVLVINLFISNCGKLEGLDSSV